MDVEANKVLSADGAIHYSIFAIGEVTAGEVYYISAMTKSEMQPRLSHGRLSVTSI